MLTASQCVSPDNSCTTGATLWLAASPQKYKQRAAMTKSCEMKTDCWHTQRGRLCNLFSISNELLVVKADVLVERNNVNGAGDRSIYLHVTQIKNTTLHLNKAVKQVRSTSSLNQNSRKADVPVSLCSLWGSHPAPAWSYSSLLSLYICVCLFSLHIIQLLASNYVFLFAFAYK